MKTYKKRIADNLLQKKLKCKGAVLLEGPKWCGKTTTAEQASASIIYMDDPSKSRQYLMLADTDPLRLLEGDNPRLIDEWQLAAKIWDAVRFSVDHRQQFGLYILTGSSVPANIEDIHHAGTGRFSWLRMRPMSLFESGESSGEVSLSSLFNSKEIKLRGTSHLSLDDIAFLICRGGWPMSVALPSDLALQQAIDYYDAVINEDISRIDGIKKDSFYVKQLMRSYARNQGSQASINMLLNGLSKKEENNPCDKSIISYIKALKKMFVIEDMEAWNPNLRSKTAIRTADTRYFVDPSIATASLGVGPADLLNDLQTMGILFETLAIRDLRVYADAIDASVYHYRDKSNLECDAVLHCRNGTYGLIEIKLGGDKLIEDGATTLKKLASKIDTEKMKEPSFLMVLTAIGDFAYKRSDNVLVVPIGCLKD